jgi:hypothetical protein
VLTKNLQKYCQGLILPTKTTKNYVFCQNFLFSVNSNRIFKVFLWKIYRKKITEILPASSTKQCEQKIFRFYRKNLQKSCQLAVPKNMSRKISCVLYRKQDFSWFLLIVGLSPACSTKKLCRNFFSILQEKFACMMWMNQGNWGMVGGYFTLSWTGPLACLNLFTAMLCG